MTEERDPEVSRRYRELGSEEPPRALDERILARARRRRGFRWYGPVAAAAILVLVVAVTVQVERQRPDEAAVPEPRARDSARQEAAPETRERKTTEAQPVPEASAMRRAAPSVGAAAARNENPEAWLEAIAQLRLQGRHPEADESLKQFRERYPDYTISDEVRAKVEKK